VVGYVTDLTNAPVAGATVYLVPQADVNTLSQTPIVLKDIVAERASLVDEPLEDNIDLHGATYTKAVTDAGGVYRITTVPASGSFFVVAVPSDPDHLPGGTHCREPMASATLIGHQVNMQVSSKPSDGAYFVGASACYNCHGRQHEKYSLHLNGIRVTGKVGPLQKANKDFPNWNEALAKFTAGDSSTGGTMLYYSPVGAAAAAKDWKLSETDPGAGVVLTARLYSVASPGVATRYFVQLTDRISSAPITAEAEFSYGGGLYKQRWVTKIGSSRYIIPIQYNFDSGPNGGNAINEATDPASRWNWQQYNLGNWFTASTGAVKLPAVGKAFDNNCAGCHFTGFQLTSDATTSEWKAHAVADQDGEVDYDLDGQTELMNTSCENCHGPGSDHWAAAGQGKLIVSPRLLTPEREVTICASCHTRVLGVGGGNTETPLNAAGLMARPGIRRSAWLTNYVSKLDDGLWNTVKANASGTNVLLGDGLHSQKHHQQASDFVKSGKYRSQFHLVTCSSCHSPHGTSTPVSAPVAPHQLEAPLDAAPNTSGLCLGCHGGFFPAGATVGARMQAHYAAQGIQNTGMGNIRCSDCHNPKTAKSGAGLKQAFISSVQYWSGDISSHLFKPVALRAVISGKVDTTITGSDVMPIPYTNKCGGCHGSAP
jgi:hypothetical protein